MKITISLVYTVIILSGIILIPNVFAENVPEWVKNTAGWWSTDAISESEFVNAIAYLVKEDIIQVDASHTSETAQSVPEWVKNTAGWWSTDAISDSEFVNAITHLIKVGIIITPQAENILKDTITIKPSYSILDTTSFFEVKVDHIPIPARLHPEFYDKNSEGFRGAEFSKDKPDNTYRIIAVGGSTTFGSGVITENTWPKILEKKIQNLSESKNIEIINAGKGGSRSLEQSELIKEKLIQYKPDLLIVYGGHNDASCKMVEHVTKDHNQTKEVKIEECGTYSPDNYDKTFAERWSEICSIGEKNGFETVFILQPMPTFDKILSEQELVSYFLRQEHTLYLDSLESFAEQLSTIEKHCTITADFREIFDYHLEPIYFDYVHIGERGNEIIADELLELISPMLHEKGITKQTPVQYDTIKPSQDPEIILQLYETNWGNLLPNQKNFVGQNLSGKDFSNSNLENKIFFGSDLRGANFENSILSGSDFSLANLADANFKNVIINGIKLRQTTLDHTDFSNVDFSQVNLKYVDLTNTILKNTNLSFQNLSKTFIYKADLSGADLTFSDLRIMYLKDTVLKNANLTKANLYEADLSLVLDKDISGATLYATILTWNNLKDIDFSGIELTRINFQGSDLSGQDFTNSGNLRGNDFAMTNLSNTNFEGVDLSNSENCADYSVPFPKTNWLDCDQPYQTFSVPNQADLIQKLIVMDSVTSIFDTLHDNFFAAGNYNILKISKVEYTGDVISVNYTSINFFQEANLENANFKDAKLMNADFSRANLTNADLSGADLRNTHFSNADLSNANLIAVNLTYANLPDANLSGANLSGANLSGANLSGANLTDANLNCRNHSICESD